ncbi:MAG: magnesium transporter CorA family protein [Bacteroidales bacterium]|jgi:magnesium transporter|nr:magnesium transporter CorA family protein [Bacteroidales bacterium]
MIETIQHGQLKWQHITNPSEDDYKYLLDEYQFHPLDIEDCRGTNQRPKIDEYDDYYFLILHFPYFDKGNKFVRIREVKIFWGKDYIITIGKSHWVVKKLFDEMQEDLAENDEDTLKALSCSDLLLYTILDRLMLETYTLILRVGAEVDLINYDIFNKKAQSIIEIISITRRNIIALNTTFKPQLRVLHMFESGGIKGFVNAEQVDMEDYWGDILDQYQKMFDLVEDYGELIEGLSKTFDSLQANKTNEIMKVLTYFSTIMLPLTVVTGIFGMNVDFPFISNTTAFWGIIAAMILLMGGLLIFFQRRSGR